MYRAHPAVIVLCILLTLYAIFLTGAPFAPRVLLADRV